MFSNKTFVEKHKKEIKKMLIEYEKLKKEINTKNPIEHKKHILAQFETRFTDRYEK